MAVAAAASLRHRIRLRPIRRLRTRHEAAACRRLIFLPRRLPLPGGSPRFDLGSLRRRPIQQRRLLEACSARARASAVQARLESTPSCASRCCVRSLVRRNSARDVAAGKVASGARCAASTARAISAAPCMICRKDVRSTTTMPMISSPPMTRSYPPKTLVWSSSGAISGTNRPTSIRRQTRRRSIGPSTTLATFQTRHWRTCAGAS